MATNAGRHHQESCQTRGSVRDLACALILGGLLVAALGLGGISCGDGTKNAAPDPTLSDDFSACSGKNLEECLAAHCDVYGPGCCPLSATPGCFKPPDGVVYTACGTDPSKACVILPTPTPGGPGTQVKITNKTESEVTVYINFYSSSELQPSDWSSFCAETGKSNCTFNLAGKASQALPNPNGKILDFNASFGADAWSCPTPGGATLAEANVNTAGNGQYGHDTADISLVNGYNASVRIDVSLNDGPTTTLGPVTSKDGNEGQLGVFPYGCDVCVARCQPGCDFIPPDTPIPCTTPTACEVCTGDGTDGCKTGGQYDPSPPCQYQLLGTSEVDIVFLGLN